MTRQAQALSALVVPDSLAGRLRPSTTVEVDAFEEALVEFLSDHTRFFTANPDYFRLRALEFRLLRQLLPEVWSMRRRHDALLEIGCGFGFQTLLLSPYAQRVVGVDIPETYASHVVSGSGTSVDIAKDLVHGVLAMQEIEFRTAWPQHLDDPDGTYDALYSAYVLEHVPDLDSLAAELARVLRPGGVMVHVVPQANDALAQFVLSNTRVPVRQLAAAAVRRLRRNGARGGVRLALNGTVVPACHSEFLSDFQHQLDVYSLEHYLFPFLDAGLQVQRLLQTRESNRVLVLRKP